MCDKKKLHRISSVRVSDERSDRDDYENMQFIYIYLENHRNIRVSIQLTLYHRSIQPVG